jgi:hypothetical protein
MSMTRSCHLSRQTVDALKDIAVIPVEGGGWRKPGGNPF